MSMARVDKYPECFLGSVVNPGEYWLISKLKPHVKEVREMEEALSDEMNGILSNPDPELLDNECCVAVEDASNRGTWKRGKILNKKDNDMFDVFLIDSGCFVEVSINQLQLIQLSRYTEVEPLAFKLCLYGIIPCTVIEESLQKQVSDYWVQSAQDYINHFFSQRLLIFAKKNCISKRTVFGDIYLVDKPDGELYSLRRLLCVNSFAVYSEAYFRERVMLAASHIADENAPGKNFNYTADLNMKLSRVEEWRLSSLQYQANGKNGGTENCEGGQSSSNSKENKDNSSKSNNENASVASDTSKPGEPGSTPVARSEVGLTNGSKALKAKNQGSGKQLVKNAKKKKPSKPTKEEDEEYRLVFEEEFVYVPEIKEEANLDVFCYFADSIIRPVDRFRSLNASDNLIANLEKAGDFEHLSSIQKWAIPSIRRGHNLVILGGPGTGKSLSYIFPIVELLTQKYSSKEIITGNGPLAVVLCSGSRSCQSIFKAFYFLSTHDFAGTEAPDWSLKIKFRTGVVTETFSLLTNGCDVLITTPHCLVRLLKHRTVTNFERLSFMVLDEVDLLVQEPFFSQVKLIMQRSKLSNDVQKVFCGERWSADLGNLIKGFSKDYSIVMGSFVEVAIFAHLKPNVLYVGNEKKSEVLLDITLNKIGTSKIMIACEKTSEVLHLRKIFKAKGHAPFAAHSDMVTHDVKGLGKRWKNGKHSGLIICTDDVIQDLGINDVETLIHYSLPYTSKTNFGNRFSAIAGTVKSNLSQGKSHEKLSVFVLLDDENHYQLPYIVDFIERLGGSVPERIKDLCCGILRNIETNKREVPVCQNLLEFGLCKNTRRCSRRHTLIGEIDSAPVPICGLVKFQILHVHTTSHLSVRLLQFIDKFRDNYKTDVRNLTPEIENRLQQYYSDHKQRRPMRSVKINDLCALEWKTSEEIKFHRAKIFEYTKCNKRNEPSEVVVNFIDTGHQITIEVSKLYELPHCLKEYPPQATDVYICNLLPADYDSDWSEKSITNSKKVFLKELKDNQYWIGQIKLSLKSSLFLDNVKLSHNLETLNTEVVDFSAQRKLIALQVAVENGEHLDRLYALCKEADIDTLIYESVKKPEKSICQPQPAFFVKDFMKVQFLSAEDVSCVFLRSSKFKDLVDSLEKECQFEGEKLSNANKRKLIRATDKEKLFVGMYCLALYESSWNRAKVESLEDGKILVFFLDYGDYVYAEYILPVPDKFLLRLPAQAIECYLMGLNQERISCDKILDEIYGFSKEGCEDVYVQVIENHLLSEKTGGRKYGVNIVNADGKSLNKLLIDSGLVKPTEDHMKFAVDMTTSPSEAEKSDTGPDEDALRLIQAVLNDLSRAHRASNENSDLKCLMNMDPNVFDDENAQNLLRDFMNQFFPGHLEARAQNKSNIIEKAGTASLRGEAVSPEIKPDLPPQNEGEITTEIKPDSAIHNEILAGIISDSVTQGGVGITLEIPAYSASLTDQEVLAKIRIDAVPQYEGTPGVKSDFQPQNEGEILLKIITDDSSTNEGETPPGFISDTESYSDIEMNPEVTTDTVPQNESYIPLGIATHPPLKTVGEIPPQITTDIVPKNKKIAVEIKPEFPPQYGGGIPLYITTGAVPQNGSYVPLGIATHPPPKTVGEITPQITTDIVPQNKEIAMEIKPEFPPHFGGGIPLYISTDAVPEYEGELIPGIKLEFPPQNEGVLPPEITPDFAQIYGGISPEIAPHLGSPNWWLVPPVMKTDTASQIGNGEIPAKKDTASQIGNGEIPGKSVDSASQTGEGFYYDSSDDSSDDEDTETAEIPRQYMRVSAERPGIATRNACSNCGKGLYTPLVLWCQDPLEVRVKIMMDNVVDYEFHCNVENFIFRCLLNGKLYVAGMKLFGAVNPDLTEFEVKAYFIEIIFKKICMLTWPQLQRPQRKFRWVKYNIEDFVEEEDILIEQICRKGMERMRAAAAAAKKKSVKDEKLASGVPPSDSESDSVTESEDEEAEAE